MSGAKNSAVFVLRFYPGIENDRNEEKFYRFDGSRATARADSLWPPGPEAGLRDHCASVGGLKSRARTEGERLDVNPCNWPARDRRSVESSLWNIQWGLDDVSIVQPPARRKEDVRIAQIPDLDSYVGPSMADFVGRSSEELDAFVRGLRYRRGIEPGGQA